MQDMEALISLYFSKNGQLSEEELARLSQWIDEDEKNALEFAQAAVIHRAIHDVLIANTVPGDIELNLDEHLDGDKMSSENDILDAIQDLAEHEKTAVGAIVEKTEESKSIDVQLKVVRYSKAVKITDKLSFYYFLVSTAAIIFLCIYINLYPSASGVATVTQSINAKWIENSKAAATGSRLYSDRVMNLQKGIIEITFDSGAEVIFEGPAKFCIENIEQMRLESGLLYAKIPEQAIGFVINTPSARVIDLGTEFGIAVSESGISSVHMTKGQAMLSDGKGVSGNNSVVLNVGQAKKIDSQGKIENIKYQPDKFVSLVDSKKHLVWRGIGADIEIANFSFESPYLGLGHADFGIITWDFVGAVGVSGNGIDGQKIIRYNGDSSSYLSLIDGYMINMINREGDQFAWMNTDVNTSLSQIIAEPLSGAKKYTLTAALAKAFWNPPTDSDLIEIQIYVQSYGSIDVLASRSVNANELNWSNGNEFIDFSVELDGSKVSSVYEGQMIGVRFVSSYEETATENGDWVIDNVRMKYESLGTKLESVFD